MLVDFTIWEYSEIFKTKNSTILGGEFHEYFAYKQMDMAVKNIYAWMGSQISPTMRYSRI